MTEYLVCTPEYAKKSRFTPAHLIYKIDDGRLFRKQIPISLKGGVMVIGMVQGDLPRTLISEILTECARFDFCGVFMGINPVPCDEIDDFIHELSRRLFQRNIKFFLPMTYSSYSEAFLLIPAINTSKSFKAYLEEICKRFPAEKLSLELSTQPIEFKIGNSQSECGTPITYDRLKALLNESGAITFYSHDLCSNYFTCGGSFIVFDTPETLKLKKNIAQELGFDSVFYIISPKNTTTLEKLELVE